MRGAVSGVAQCGTEGATEAPTGDRLHCVHCLPHNETFLARERPHTAPISRHDGDPSREGGLAAEEDRGGGEEEGCRGGGARECAECGEGAAAARATDQAGRAIGGLRYSHQQASCSIRCATMRAVSLYVYAHACNPDQAMPCRSLLLACSALIRFP